MKRYNDDDDDDSKLTVNTEDTLIIQKESWRCLCKLWYVWVCFVYAFDLCVFVSPKVCQHQLPFLQPGCSVPLCLKQYRDGAHFQAWTAQPKVLKKLLATSVIESGSLFFTDKSKLCQCLCSSMFLWMFFTCSGEEEAPSWSTYVGKMFTAASSYLPAQVSGMMSQDRAFATVRLQMAGQKNVCALAMWVLQSLHSNLEWVTVFTEEKTHSRVSLDLSESRNFHVCLWPPLMGSYSSITSTLKMGVSALWCRSTGEFSLFF